jgi:alkyl hydroperoxide reductase subunit AhpC
MLELGELERHHEDFSRRNWRVVVVSMEGPEEAKQTQADFPHLLVVTDHERGLSDAVGLIHPGSGPGGGDTSAPTTILVDRDGIVRWLYRPPSAISRLSPDEVLRAIDSYGGDSG